MNSFGTIYRLTTFGESHGPAIGGVIDGMPAGIEIDIQAVQRELDRRRPGQSALTTARNEADRVEFLSGIFEGRSTGAPIGFIVRNADHHSADYDNLRHAFRPSHADFTYSVKYGHRDHRGGGRSSARITIPRVVAGAIAKQALAKIGVEVHAYTSQVGAVRLEKPYTELDLSLTDSNAVRCPDADAARRMTELITEVKGRGDTVGGVITGVITGVPAGLGEPEGDKLHAALGAAMLSINAAKGFDYGMGFDGASMLGSEAIDKWAGGTLGRVGTATNRSGGIQGGISNGEDIYFRVAFKPVATLLQPVAAVSDTGEPIELQVRGRHDPCVLPRAVPIVEAMAAITVLDAWLKSKAAKM